MHSQGYIFSLYRRVVIILEIDVLKPADEVAGRIGEPTPYIDGKTCWHKMLGEF